MFFFFFFFFSVNTINIFISCKKTFKFSLVLRTRENTDVFITLEENIYGIHPKRVNILYISLEHLLELFVALRKHAYSNILKILSPNTQKIFR